VYFFLPDENEKMKKEHGGKFYRCQFCQKKINAGWILNDDNKNRGCYECLPKKRVEKYGLKITPRRKKRTRRRRV